MPVDPWWLIPISVALLAFVWGWYSSGLVLDLVRDPLQAVPSDFGMKSEDVRFQTEEGIELVGWFIPASSPTDRCLILCHGWGTNRSNILPSTVFLGRRGGYNLFYFDFRNHGESGGDRSSLIYYERKDLEAAVRYLKKEKSPQAKRLGIYGLSMGAAVALSVTEVHSEIEAIVAESGFTSFNEVIIRFGRLFYHMPRWMAHWTLMFVRARLGFDPEPYSPIYSIEKIAPRPLFLIQGDQDTRMPVSEGEALFARAGEPKTLWTIPGADHGEAHTIAGREYEDRLLEFFNKAFESTPSVRP
ncbi:MAG TPA: alpha/beta hydrolase [Elusimicrobiota bacterium]|nr:alpha/beta hydrolase [Elusimicrobiota bacterium]